MRYAAWLAVVGSALCLAAACNDERCCVSNRDCASGAACFEGRCALVCEHDAQCVVGQTCTAGVCVDPARSDTVCDFAFGGVTDGGAGDGGVPSACVDDGAEPNNDLVEASDAREGTFELCPLDVDYFRVHANAGEIIVATINFDAQVGDLDLELLLGALPLAPNPTTVAVSRGITGVEEIVYTAATSGTYYVKVSGFNEARGQYELSLSVDGLPFCEDDFLEDNDTLEAFSSLPAGGISLMACGGDWDLLAWEASDEPLEGGRRFALESFEPNVVGYFWSTATGAVAVLEPGGSLETPTRDLVRAAIWRRGGSAFDAANYWLAIDMIDPPDGCCGDPSTCAEPGWDSAPELVGPTSYEANTCSNDVDRYRVTFSDLANLDLSVTTQTGVPTPTVAVFEDDQLLFIVHEALRRDFGVPSGATNTFRVSVQGRGEGAYSLTIP